MKHKDEQNNSRKKFFAQKGRGDARGQDVKPLRPVIEGGNLFSVKLIVRKVTSKVQVVSNQKLEKKKRGTEDSFRGSGLAVASRGTRGGKAPEKKVPFVNH